MTRAPWKARGHAPVTAAAIQRFRSAGDCSRCPGPYRAETHVPRIKGVQLAPKDGQAFATFHWYAEYVSSGGINAMKRLLTVAVLFFLTHQMAQAAEISVLIEGTKDHPALILIQGKFTNEEESIDKGKFAEISAAQKNGAVVFLESQGGSLMTGTWLGRTIRVLGFTTAVGENVQCVSACAIAWLGGRERFMAPHALVGFHSATKWPWSRREIDPHGNTIISLYLDDMGFKDRNAASYLTAAAPSSMTWVNADTLGRYGIEVNDLNLSHERWSWIRSMWPLLHKQQATHHREAAY
jgi:hypothetical protein